MSVQARVVVFHRGASWVAEGWRMFRVSPLAWVALVLAYYMVMTFVSVLPLIGVVAAAVLVPPFSVGFMAASRRAAAGAAVRLEDLFAGFRSRVGAQVLLGGVYLASLAALLAATALADGGALARWMLSGERPDEAIVRSGGFLSALALAAALYAPVMMAYWFAPVLAAWHALAPAKALFFSFFACLMNWRAFVAYGIATTLLTLVVPVTVVSVLALLTPGPPNLRIVSLVFPMLLVILPVMLASFYASYRDVFGQADARPEDAGAT